MTIQKICVPLLLLFLSYDMSSQHTPDTNLYAAFDNSVGVKNLGINNGTIHINNYKAINSTHRYFQEDKYYPGNVEYDGQPYLGLNLKYDIFKDILIAKIYGIGNSLGINLITEKTESFTIDGKKFVNLNFNQNKVPDFVKGYYEKFSDGGKLSLYIKYHKDAIEILEDVVYYKFEGKINFVIGYNNTFYKIDTQRDAEKALPDYEKQIGEYYQMNHDLEKSDKIQFMKDMIKYLNNFLVKETN